jgi:hypothetical protein
MREGVVNWEKKGENKKRNRARDSGGTKNKGVVGWTQRSEK